jgi:hypothetical protein
LRDAIPSEVKNISQIAEWLQTREANHMVDGQTAHLGMQVVALTNANWQTASATGAAGSMDYGHVERFAAAYFEQARLAQLQTATLDCMMGLTSYVGHGERVALMTADQARLAEAQAQLLMAHLRMMLRMSGGVQDAYKAALRGS